MLLIGMSPFEDSEPKAYSKFSRREISLEKVKPDRFELDKIILQDILGLNEAEHLEVYRAVVDLVRSRLDKARSVDKQNKKNGGAVGHALKYNIVEDFDNGG